MSRPVIVRPTFPRSWAGAGALLLAGARVHAGDEDRPVARAVRTDAPPVIDGRLDEAAWQRATPIGELTQIDPLEGAPPSEATEIRFLFDADHLYMAVRCFDRDPNGILVTTRERDALLEVDDRVEIVFDTFHDRRNAFFFQINAGGSKGDALVTNNGANFNKPWDGIWDGAARVDEAGWSAELALPFKTLNFRPGEPWGFNVERRIGRKREEARWSRARRDYSLFNIFHAGELVGLEGIHQGIGLDVVPFFVAHGQRDRAGDDERLLGEPGFDLFYKLTPSLTLSLTVNTDFAETEVDQFQVDLSRFDLFFPERRDFFLQDSGLFEFGLSNGGSGGGGGGDRSLIPFFSRRIGLAADGREVPILAGTKLTGRLGPYGIGLLDVQTDELGTQDGQNLLAARVTRDVGEQSTVGAILTRGDPEGERDNLVYGLDAAYRTSRFNGNQNLVTTGYLLRSDGEDVRGAQSAFGVSVRAPSDLLTWSLGASEIEGGFEPELGFVPRNDVRRYTANLDYTPRPGWDGVRQVGIGVASVAVTDADDDALETWDVELQAFGVELESGDEIALGIFHTHDELEEDFVIFEDPDSPDPSAPETVSVPAGSYDFARAGFELRSAENRALSAGLEFVTGEFFDGRRDSYELELVWHPGPLFAGSLGYERNDISLADGDFVVQLGLLRANFSFTPELSWNNLVQWSTEEDVIGIQSRLRWIPRPHQEVFLVFTEKLESDSTSGPLEEELSFKVTTTLRF